MAIRKRLKIYHFIIAQASLESCDNPYFELPYSFHCYIYIMLDYGLQHSVRNDEAADFLLLRECVAFVAIHNVIQQKNKTTH
ncbi:hypothetical protein [Helicobacter rodentium]|uniref:hypothetical protein n=1 Tax=Helicobacter rodentium TaxID=59617 RepID=UPI000A4025CB|nr:hypothetical protein [Helicobacter rodentium]